MRVSLDCESNGLDVHHNCRPFFVTVCFEDGKQLWWEWEVDVHTRQVLIPNDDVWEIQSILDSADEIIGQNLKFDAGMLASVGVTLDWSKVQDTLIASHLLASNQPHNLTALVLTYLGKDIEPLEVKLREAVQAARRLCRRDFPDWRIAREGLPELPSVKSGAGKTAKGGEKGTAWAADYWLPKAVATTLGIKDDDPRYHWHTVLRDYSNVDSACVLPLWHRMEAEIHRRKLRKIYHCRMELPAIAQRIEARGVTVNGDRLNRLLCDYETESERLGQVCVNVARDMGEELVLPALGNNRSLTTFVETLMTGVQQATGQRFMIPRTDTGQIQVTKASIDYYESHCPERDCSRLFWQSLKAKRRRDTAVSFMEGYRRFWVPVVGAVGWYRLHPSINPTGTDTLRWSSSNPNSQNLSAQEDECPRCENKEPERLHCGTCGGEGVTFRSLRYCLGPMPGREWWSFDAKNLELRLPAYESGERLLIDLFEKPNDPPYYGSEHLLNFHTVYEDLWDEAVREVGLEKAGPHCKKKYKTTWYHRCKCGGFAVGYGAIDRIDGTGTADRAFGRPGSHAKLKARFARKEALNQKYIQLAERNGCVETIPDKEVDGERGYPILCTRTEYGRILPTVPLNYHIQSTACWWMSKAMIRVEKQLQKWREEGFDGWLILQVHDEIVVDLPRGADPKLIPNKSNLVKAREIQRLMELGGSDLGIPTPVSCNYHPSTYSEEVSF